MIPQIAGAIGFIAGFSIATVIWCIFIMNT